MKRIVLIIVCLLLLTGCWNRREFNELAITYGLGIDRVDGEYMVSAQVINPEQVAGTKTGGGGTRSPVLLFEAKEKTILNALRKLSRTASRKIYAAHLYALVISEEVAREGVSDVLDFIYRDPEIRTDFYVFIAKGDTAKGLLSVLTPFAVAPSQELYDRLRYSERNWDPAKATSIREFITNIITDGIHPTVTSIVVNESGSNSSNQNTVPVPPLPTGNIAVFHDDKLEGWLTEDQGRTLNTVINNIVNSVVNFPCGKEGYGVIESPYVKTKMTPSMKDEPKMKLEINYKSRISELDCNQKTATVDEIKEIEKDVEKYLKQYFTRNIKEIQEEIGIDIFGFGQEFYRQKPKEWKKIKDNWDKSFKDLAVDVEVKVHITNSGTIEDSLKNRLK